MTFDLIPYNILSRTPERCKMNTLKMKWIKNGQFVPESCREFVLILADIFIHGVGKIVKTSLMFVVETKMEITEDRKL